MPAASEPVAPAPPGSAGMPCLWLMGAQPGPAPAAAASPNDWVLGVPVVRASAAPTSCDALWARTPGRNMTMTLSPFVSGELADFAMFAIVMFRYPDGLAIALIVASSHFVGSVRCWMRT